MALWSQSRYIVIPLVVIILGHWSLILQGKDPMIIMLGLLLNKS